MRTGKFQNGRFDVQPGMAFMMPSMSVLYKGKYEKRAGEHPWLITAVNDDSIEIVMCSTLKFDKEDKYRLYSLAYDDADIHDGCPPMENGRTSRASLDTFMVLPKKDFFTHDLKLLNDNTAVCNFRTKGMESLCMSDKMINYLCAEINEYLADHSAYDYDPYQCMYSENCLLDLEDGLPVPEGFTEQAYRERYGWEDLPEADPYAAYPFEDTMHPYERNDHVMLKLVRTRDMRKTHKDENVISFTDEDISYVPMDDALSK